MRNEREIETFKLINNRFESWTKKSVEISSKRTENHKYWMIKQSTAVTVANIIATKKFIGNFLLELSLENDCIC